MSMEQLTKEILRLTETWYKYVGLLGHYKDRDCHWYIEADFAYGGPPIFRVRHSGYIGDGFEVTAMNWHEANRTLLDLVRDQFLDEREWAQNVVREGLAEWDECQVEAAEFILEVDLHG